MNLNQLVDKLEFAIARNSTPAILALTKQIHSDGTAFHNSYNTGQAPLNETPEDFQAMFRRFKAAEAAGAAAIASKETKQVTAGVDGANQSTAGVANVRASEPTPLPGSSFTPPTTPADRQLSIIANMLSEQRESIASIQKNQEVFQQNQ